MTDTSRTDIYKKTIKQGMAKESFDKVLDNMAKPLANMLKPTLQKLNPNIDFLDPVVQSGLEMATCNAIAEIVKASGYIAHNIPGLNMSEDEAIDKMDAAARALRGYSGERLGTEAGKVSVMLFPMVKQFLTNANLAGILDKPKETKALGPSKADSLISLLEGEEVED